MSTTATEEPRWPELQRARRAIVVVDVVESVRLMQQHEDDVIDRWRRFVHEVRTEVLPPHGGRLVKSLGDGMLLEFASVPAAVAASLDLQRRIGAYNIDRRADAALRLRIGLHVDDIVVDDLDVYGNGVNFASRLNTLGDGGDIIVSADVRDSLVPDLDASIVDLGECELKGLAEPARAFRILPPSAGSQSQLAPSSQGVDPRPTIVMLPLDVRAPSPEAFTVSDIVTDDVVLGLSVSQQWKVISRLTANAYRGRKPSLSELREALGATYVLSGSCRVVSGQVRVFFELADAASNSVVLARSLRCDRSDLLGQENPIAESIKQDVCAAVYEHELRRSRMQALPTLRSYSVLFSSIALMHRLSRSDFARSRQMLEFLIERLPRAPEPRIWLAKWHVMNVAQGWSSDPVEQSRKGHDLVQRALDQQSDNALALAIDGLICAFLQGDLDASEQRYEAALAANPNEALAWLFMSALHAYRDRGEQAVSAAMTALRLSPLDPMRYFYDSFAANALLAAGRYDESIALGRRSIRANCTHMPTFRSLAIALVLNDEVEQARQTMRELLKLEPGYSITRFQQRYAGRASRHASVYADALRAAGLPER
jgi:adenylate cyclase